MQTPPVASVVEAQARECCASWTPTGGAYTLHPTLAAFRPAPELILYFETLRPAVVAIDAAPFRSLDNPEFQGRALTCADHLNIRFAWRVARLCQLGDGAGVLTGRLRIPLPEPEHTLLEAQLLLFYLRQTLKALHTRTHAQLPDPEADVDLLCYFFPQLFLGAAEHVDRTMRRLC